MKWLLAFKYAFRGIGFAFAERSFRMHVVCTLLVIAAGLFFDIDTGEWLAVLISIGVVMAAEVLNTAIERLTDMVSPEHNPAAGKVKDLAAGAVLLCALAAAAVGLIVFLPKISACL